MKTPALLPVLAKTLALTVTALTSVDQDTGPPRARAGKNMAGEPVEVVLASEIELRHELVPKRIASGCVLADGKVILLGVSSGGFHVFDPAGKQTAFFPPVTTDQRAVRRLDRFSESGQRSIARTWGRTGGEASILVLHGLESRDVRTVQFRGFFLCGLGGREGFVVGLAEGGARLTLFEGEEMAPARHVDVHVDRTPAHWVGSADSGPGGSFAALAYFCRSGRVESSEQCVGEAAILVFNRDLSLRETHVLPRAFRNRVSRIQYNGEVATVVGASVDGPAGTSLWRIDCSSGEMQRIDFGEVVVRPYRMSLLDDGRLAELAEDCSVVRIYGEE